MEVEANLEPAMFAETLKRQGESWESKARLMRKCDEAEQLIGIHGVSVSAGLTKGVVSHANRQIVEQYFKVHDTPTKKDRLHRTIELPKPVTDDIVETFNHVFGRTRTAK